MAQHRIQLIVGTTCARSYWLKRATALVAMIIVALVTTVMGVKMAFILVAVMVVIMMVIIMIVMMVIIVIIIFTLVYAGLIIMMAMIVTVMMTIVAVVIMVVMVISMVVIMVILRMPMPRVGFVSAIVMVTIIVTVELFFKCINFPLQKVFQWTRIGARRIPCLWGEYIQKTKIKKSIEENGRYVFNILTFSPSKHYNNVIMLTLIDKRMHIQCVQKVFRPFLFLQMFVL